MGKGACHAPLRNIWGLQRLNYFAGECGNLFAPALEWAARSHDEFARAHGDIICDFCADLFGIAEGDELAHRHVRARPNRLPGQCMRLFQGSGEEKVQAARKEKGLTGISGPG